MKKFRSKKRKGNGIIFIGIFVLSVAFTIKYLYTFDLINNDTLISFLINDNLETYKSSLDDVDFLLKYAINMDLKKESEWETNKEEVKDVIKIEEDKPIVYIYNTHQEEKYQTSMLEAYNISSTVLVASKILKEYLRDLGINAVVEEESVADTLHSFNLKYGKSYQITRMFMEGAKENTPTLKYFIDLHRDSSNYEKTTTTIDGEKYARLLFVVGLDHDNYEPNLALAENLRGKIDNYNENLCRGIMKKSGKGVNGIYNQDFSEYTMLIEVGGQYNNISEVNNTLKVLAKILYEYIEEVENEEEKN